MRRRFNLAAQLRGHCLHAVADTEHRNTELEYELRCARRFIEIYRFGTAGKNNAAGIERTNILVGHIPGVNFGVDADFADSPGDQLCVLAAEVEDQQLVGMDIK